MDFVKDDEYVEVTPASLRMRKRVLKFEDRAKLRKGVVSVR